MCVGGAWWERGVEKEERRKRERQEEWNKAGRQAGRYDCKESNNEYVINKDTAKLGLSWTRLYVCLKFYTQHASTLRLNGKGSENRKDACKHQVDKNEGF